MARSTDGMGRDEHVILESRTHVKALFWPVVALLAAAIILGVGIAMMPTTWEPWGPWVLVGLFVVFVWWAVVMPFLRWSTSTYTLTNRRIITRAGILNKTGHDLPLRRINNVNYERSISDRILGCGTLVLETAAGQPLMLPDVPHVEQVHVAINELLFGGDEPLLETGEPTSSDD